MKPDDFVVQNGSSFRVHPSADHTFDFVKDNEEKTTEISGFNVGEARFLDSLDIAINGKPLQLASAVQSDQRTIAFHGTADEAVVNGEAFIHDNVLHMRLDTENVMDPFEVSVVAHGDFMGTFMQRQYPIVKADLADITVKKPGLEARVGKNEYSGQLYVNGQTVKNESAEEGEVATTFQTRPGHIDLAIAAKYREVGENKDISHPDRITPFTDAKEAAEKKFTYFRDHLISVTFPKDESKLPEAQTVRTDLEKQLDTAGSHLYSLSVSPQIKGKENLKVTGAGYPAFMRMFSRDTLYSIMEGGYPPEIVNNTLLLLAETIAPDGHLFHEVYKGPDSSLTPFTMDGHYEKCLAYDSPNLWLKVLGEYIEQTNHLEFLEDPAIKGAIGKIIQWNQSQLKTNGYNAYETKNDPACWDEEAKPDANGEIKKNTDPDNNGELFHLMWMDGGVAKTTAEGDAFLTYPQGSIELTTQQYDAMQVLTTLQEKTKGTLLTDDQVQTAKQIADTSKENLKSKFWVEKAKLKYSYDVIAKLDEDNDIIQSIATYSGVSPQNKTPKLDDEALVKIKNDLKIMEVIQGLEEKQVGVFATKDKPYTNLDEDERIQRFADITNHYAALPEKFFTDMVATKEDGGILPSGNLASNIHHALGIRGLLDNEEIAATVEHLSNPEYGLFNPEYGLRTLSEHAVKYVPHEYQRGAIWPYDTALAMKHLRAQGDICMADGNEPLAQKCYAAVDAYAKTLNNVLKINQGSSPEFLNAATGEGDETACKPQQWSLQVPFAVLTALTGMDIKRPATGMPEVSFHPINNEVRDTYFPLKVIFEVGERPYAITAEVVDGQIIKDIRPVDPKSSIHSVASPEMLEPAAQRKR